MINAIRKESRDKDYLMNIDYPVHLWMEKEIKSVANVSRQDISEFLSIAAQIPIIPVVETFPLKEANLHKDAGQPSSFLDEEPLLV